jgi:type IV secretory pathway VirB6-like protein
VSKWLSIFVLSFFLGNIFLATTAYALPANPGSMQNFYNRTINPGGFCDVERQKGLNPPAPIPPATRASPSFIAPLIRCFMDTNQGILPTYVSYFLSSPLVATYKTIVVSMYTLAVVLLGIRIATGNMQNMKHDIFLLAFKIAGVVWFMLNAELVYNSLIQILIDFGNIMSDAASSLNHNGFCNTSLSSQNGLWDRLDCIFAHIFDFAGAATTVGGIAAIVFMLIWTFGTGIVIFFMAFFLIINLFFAAARCIHMYLMAVLGLSFIFCFGYIFVPLILFKGTINYFKKWLEMCFGYILLPIIVTGYMGMMLVAVDVVVFSGNFSIYHAIAPNVDATGAEFTDAMDHHVDAFKSFFFIAFNNNSGNSVTPINTGLTGGKGATVNGPSSTPPAASSNVGLNMTGLNIDYMAYCAGKCGHGIPISGVPPGTPCTPAPGPNEATSYCSAMQIGQYVVDILVSFAVATLLMWIMYSLLSYIPTLAGDMVGSGMQAATNSIVKSGVFAESLTRNTAEMAKNQAIGMASKRK